MEIRTAKRTFPWERITLAPLSDFQYGAPGCDVEGFKRHIDAMLEKDAWFYWLGDIVDHASPSGRKKIRDADFYDTTQDALEERAWRDLEAVQKILEPTKDRTLFVVHGHHSYDFPGGGTTDTKMAEYLGAEYMGTLAAFEIILKKGTNQISCEIIGVHGEKSSVSSALMLRWMETNLLSAWPNADIISVAHCHQAAGELRPGLIPLYAQNEVKAKTRVLCVTGGWLKGYQAGSQRGGRPQGGYVERALLAPTVLGGVEITVEPKHTSTHNYLKMGVTT